MPVKRPRSRPQRVGVLTGGGDVPGLNSVIRALVWRLEEHGHQVLGLRRGWAALLHCVPDPDADNSEWLLPLDRESTRRIDRFGGTILHSSRVNPALFQPADLPERLRPKAPQPGPEGLLDLTPHCLEVLEFLRLDALVAIGGDGTLAFAQRLDREGVPLLAIPKTMDNDVYGTDYCVGFSTAVTRSVRFINDLRTAAGSHERLLVVELFGRYSGETCLLTSYLANTDRALISEAPFETERVVDLLRRDRAGNPSRYAVVAVSEGAYPRGSERFESGRPDVVGHRKLGGVGAYLAEELQRRGLGVVYQQLGYLMRSGPPDSLDQLVAKNFGHLAADLIEEGRTGQMAAILGGKYAAVPVEALGDGIKRVDVDRFYDAEEYRPKAFPVLEMPMFLH